MAYLLNGVMLGCIWFLSINVAASLFVATWQGHALKPRGVASLPSTRARVLLFFRLFPAAVSLMFVAGILVPSYWRLEPRDLSETFGFAPWAFVAVSGLLLATAIRRGAVAYWRASRCTRAWMLTARPIVLPGTPVPVLCVEGIHPGMTLVGVSRARLFISRPLLEALSADELEAAAGHELAHYRAGDNLKRLAILCAPDVLSLFSVGRRLDLDWALAAEHAADARVALTPKAGLDLASALVKAARLTPRPTLTGATSPLVGGTIASRVKHLTTIETVAPPARARWSAPWLLAAVVLVIGIARYDLLLHVVHAASEVFAHALP